MDAKFHAHDAHFMQCIFFIFNFFFKNPLSKTKKTFNVIDENDDDENNNDDVIV